MNGPMILLLSSWISNAASDLTVADSGTTQSVPHGHGFTVKCTVTGNDTFFAWKNPAGAVVHNNSEYQYTVSDDKHSLKIDPMLVKDGGKWTCISNEGSEDSRILHVTVSKNGNPNLQQNLISGLPGIIEVNIVGYPQPDFKWFKNGGEVTLGGGYKTASNGSLIISSVDTTDEGTYKVEAEQNSYDAKIENIVVTVLGRCNNTGNKEEGPTTTTLSNQTKTTAKGGKTISDKCNCSAEWYLFVIATICGIIIGIVFSYATMWWRYRLSKRRDSSTPSPVAEPSGEGLEHTATYEELDLQRMNEEDNNYQPLIMTSRNVPSNDAQVKSENEAGYEEVMHAKKPRRC